MYTGMQDAPGLGRLERACIDCGVREQRNLQTISIAHVSSEFKCLENIGIRFSEGGSYVHLVHVLDQMVLTIDMTDVQQRMGRFQRREIGKSRT